MKTPRLPLFMRFATLSLLLPRTFAQNDTTNSGNINTSEPNLNLCPVHVEDFNSNAPVNSTGSVNIHWNALMMDPTQNDWILTVTYNETRNHNAPYLRLETIHWLQGYISAPEVSEARTCVCMFNGLNATSSSGQQNGCDGVLSDACISLMRNITFGNDCSLPAPRSEWDQAIREACGADVLEANVETTSRPQDFTNRTCSIDHPPGSTSPEYYRTWAAMGRGAPIENVDRNASDFTWYDIYVGQTIPFVISAQFSGGIAETQVLCVAPKDVVEGGRVPAKRSTATLNLQSSSWKAVFVAVMATVVVVVI